MSATARSEAGARPGRGAACGGVLSDDLGWALGVVFRSYVKAANAAFAEMPAGPRGYQVLAAATRGEPESQLELAQHLGVDRTVMTYLLDDLEAAGLIERRPDPADRRARRIVATTAAASCSTTSTGGCGKPSGTCWPAWTPTEDRRAFRALLRRLATHADALDPVHSACVAVPDADLPGTP